MKLSRNKNETISVTDCDPNEQDENELFKSPEQFEKETTDNLKSFAALLDSLSTLHDKKTALWKQIYENAVFDRRNSYLMWTDLYQKVHGDKSEHMVHGMTLSKYMERCNKANEQIIKLAEILDQAIDEDIEEATDDEKLYDQLEEKS